MVHGRCSRRACLDEVERYRGVELYRGWGHEGVEGWKGKRVPRSGDVGRRLFPHGFDRPMLVSVLFSLCRLTLRQVCPAPTTVGRRNRRVDQ